MVFFLSFVRLVFAADYAPAVEVGACLHTGSETASLNGAKSYLLSMRAEQTHGMLRRSAGLEIEYGSGTAYVTSGVSTFTLMGGNFVAGLNLYPFADGKIRPFLGGFGVLGFDQMQLGTPLAGNAAYSQGLAYGYEIVGGVDLAKGSSSAYRIRVSIWSVSGALGGISGFQLQGVRAGIGYSY